jgi:hypothetical protein
MIQPLKLALKAQLYEDQPDTGLLRSAIPDIVARASDEFELRDDGSLFNATGEALAAWTKRLRHEVPSYFDAPQAPVEAAAPIEGRVGDGRGVNRLAHANRRS